MNKVGQLLMIGIAGTKLSKEEAEFISTNQIGGVILFKRNISEPKQIYELISDIQKNLNTPAIIGVDQEGGRVARLGEPFTQFPPMSDVGKVDNDGSISHRLGEIMGSELAAVGFNIDFAPVLDVSTNPSNPVIGDRAFSSDAEVVANLTSEFILGIESCGVGACGKHFPGHGDSDADSHKELPIIEGTVRSFNERELIPFKAAIKMGISSIMTAHLLAKPFDDKNVASVSKKIVTDLLRKKLGYDKLVFTDDLTMKGITCRFSIEDAAVKAIEAGSDIAMVCCENISIHKKILSSLKDAINDGRISSSYFDASLKRIADFKNRFCKKSISKKPNFDIIGSLGHAEFIKSHFS